jgi:flagellar biosynthesis/type III secretory pathway protein FliH
MTTPRTNDESEQTVQTIHTYVPGGYKEESWEVVEAEPASSDDFQPMEFETLEDSSYSVDPMFADFASPEFVADSFEDSKENSQERDAGSSDEFSSQLVEESQEKDDFQPDFMADEEQEHESLALMTEASSVATDGTSAIEESAEIEGKGFEPQDENEPQNGSESIVDEGLSAESDEERAIDGTSQEEFQEQAVPEIDVAKTSFEEGYAKGLEEAKEDRSLMHVMMQEQYTLLWEDMQVQLDELKQEHETRAVELAMRVANRLVGSVVNDHKEYVIDVIREALASVGKATINGIRVSPQSFELLGLDEYGEQVKIHGDQKLTFKPDESIRAGCIVETAAGESDFDLDRAWQRMYAKVTGSSEL